MLAESWTTVCVGRLISHQQRTAVPVCHIVPGALTQSSQNPRSSFSLMNCVPVGVDRMRRSFEPKRRRFGIGKIDWHKFRTPIRRRCVPWVRRHSTAGAAKARDHQENARCLLPSKFRTEACCEYPAGGVLFYRTRATCEFREFENAPLL